MAVAILRSVGSLTFDATLRESHRAELTVTDNPVETGVKVSDHAYMEPRTVTISAGVSNTPLRPLADDAFSGGTQRRVEAFRLLGKLQAEAEPFTVQTGLKLYENMLITRLSADDEASMAGALVFEAELREVLITNTETVSYDPGRAVRGRRTGAVKRQADKKKDAGEQQGGNTPVAKKQSLLRKLKGSL